MTKILRYEVPVDDRWHTLILHGPIVHVASRRPEVVEVWATDSGPTAGYTLTVVGTGQAFPPDAGYIGTAIVPGGFPVWHLIQREPS